MTKQYFIHDNFMRPFRVKVDETYIYVYRNGKDSKPPVEDVMVFACNNPEKVFIGGKKEEAGNSILVHIGAKKYVYIGEKIYSFDTNSEIVEYQSRIGNNDVPYPYAVDENNIYLMIENIVMTKSGNILGVEDPYDYYYSSCHIANSRTDRIVSDTDIHSFYINNAQYNFTYENDPAEKYDSLISDVEFKNKSTDSLPNILYITYKTKPNVKVRIDKQTYVKIVKKFGKLKGFKQLQCNEISPRIW